MMESLQLPYWMEENITSSPTTYQIANEELQLFDNFAETTENDFLLSNDTLIVADINTVPYNSNSTNTSIQNKTKTAHDLLLELDEEIKNEPSWYHNPKLDFIYEQLSPVPMQTNNSINSHHVTVQETKLQANTEELLSEFDTVCNAVGLQLTPPATPPMSPSSIKTASSPIPEISSDYLTGAPIVYIVTLDNNYDITQQEITSQNTLIDEVLSEASDDSMDLIDELVREHTTNLPDDLTSLIDDSCSIAESQISDNVSVVSSSGSDSNYSPSISDDASSYVSFMSPRSNDSFDVAGYDDEWTPSVDKKRTLKKSSGRSKADEPKKEKRGYRRPLHEKKARKKEQNKNAATRYRQKKKEQLKVVLSEEDQLLQVYNNLKTKHDDVKREIRYLKQLMKEVLIAKGVLQ